MYIKQIYNQNYPGSVLFTILSAKLTILNRVPLILKIIPPGLLLADDSVDS
jgi:hypothetical protein